MATSATLFTRALDKFRGTLSDEQKAAFSSANRNNVFEAIMKIEMQLASERKLRNLRRCWTFLVGMEKIEELVRVFLGADEFAAFLWGPIKLALTVSC